MSQEILEDRRLNRISLQLILDEGKSLLRLFGEIICLEKLYVRQVILQCIIEAHAIPGHTFYIIEITGGTLHDTFVLNGTAATGGFRIFTLQVLSD